MNREKYKLVPVTKGTKLQIAVHFGIKSPMSLGLVLVLPIFLLIILHPTGWLQTVVFLAAWGAWISLSSPLLISWLRTPGLGIRWTLVKDAYKSIGRSRGR